MEKEVQNKEMVLLLPQKLRCSVQNYDWGKIGKESEVARLFALNSRMSIEDDKPYAEIWMGTHNSGPSFILEDGEIGEKPVTLSSWISENPSVLGDKVLKEWGNHLPFLFKVLSVAKALSIQAHPDKKLAEALHKSHPDLYKDDNHKPEMALALTEFEALCGFVSLQELKDVIRTVPEVQTLVGSVEADQVLNIEQEDEEKVKSILESIFTRLMSADIDEVSRVVSLIRSRLLEDKMVRQLSDKEQLVLQLDEQYPNDIGVISAFFLNYVKVQPGEALYLGANEPHAYLSGECIECMATSDNVVRAGLTPKLRDVPTLCSMLTYKQGFPEILKGTPLNQYTKRYSPPFNEFEVDCCMLPQGASTVFPAISGPSLILVTSGKGNMQIESLMEEEFGEGNVLFVPAHTQIALTSVSDIQIYRAGVNSNYLGEE
ncbi:mannose-6-phosphate isomerase [Ranunculus cassubicifolius]